MFQTKASPAVTKAPLVLTDLCDGSVEEKEFKNTGFSRLAAREYYLDMCVLGEDLQIANQPPHVIRVQFSDGVSPETADTQFLCRCKREERIQQNGTA